MVPQHLTASVFPNRYSGGGHDNSETVAAWGDPRSFRYASCSRVTEFPDSQAAAE